MKEAPSHVGFAVRTERDPREERTVRMADPTGLSRGGAA